jgi:hypothetical protein
MRATVMAGLFIVSGVFDLVDNVVKVDEPQVKTNNCNASSNKKWQDFDTPDCRAYEFNTFSNFETDYCNNLPLRTRGDPVECRNYGYSQVQEAFEEINKLHNRFGQLDAIIGSIFPEMNSWYENSSVDETDVLNPVTTDTDYEHQHFSAKDLRSIYICGIFSAWPECRGTHVTEF